MRRGFFIDNKLKQDIIMLNMHFFAKEGEKGLNETSAQHLCAVASQLKTDAESFLSNINFVNTSFNVIGSGNPDMISDTGITKEDFATIEDKLNLVARMNAFISWFSEARKNLEDYRLKRSCVSIQAWAEETGVELPKMPNARTRFRSDDFYTVSLDDIKSEMSVKDLQEYLALEAKAAVLGKFIHSGSPMESARQLMHTRLAKPYMNTGSGRDTVVYHFTPSVPSNDVDDTFVHLQTVYRQTEQSLNHMKRDLRNKLDARILEKSNEKRVKQQEVNKIMDEYQQKMDLITIDYNQWMADEQTRISKIKFVIPDALAATVDYLNNLDNEK